MASLGFSSTAAASEKRKQKPYACSAPGCPVAYDNPTSLGIHNKICRFRVPGIQKRKDERMSAVARKRAKMEGWETAERQEPEVCLLTHYLETMYSTPALQSTNHYSGRECSSLALCSSVPFAPTASKSCWTLNACRPPCADTEEPHRLCSVKPELSPYAVLYSHPGWSVTYSILSDRSFSSLAVAFCCTNI